MKYLIIAAIFLLLTAASCKKENTPQDELSKLPPATQTGANTFGCLVNGKAWVAQTDCRLICDPPFKLYYDGSNGGYVGITADWLNSANNIKQRIDIVFDSTNYKLNHILSIYNRLTTARFVNYKSVNSCGIYEHYIDSSVIHTGIVNLNKYDLREGIISGTFEFTLTKPGCETLTVTNGRFDKKL